MSSHGLHCAASLVVQKALDHSKAARAGALLGGVALFLIAAGCSATPAPTSAAAANRIAPPLSRGTGVQKIIRAKSMANPAEQQIGFVERRENLNKKGAGEGLEIYYVYDTAGWASQRIVGYVLENGATYRAGKEIGAQSELIGNFELDRAVALLLEVDGPVRLER